MTETKLTQKEKVTKKYGAMVSYYAELLSECHNAVRKNSLLSKLDPMGQKTSATTLFMDLEAGDAALELSLIHI